jgi:cell cycle sensor histidine kinase DivJ
MPLIGDIVPGLVPHAAETEGRPRARQLWFVLTRMALGAIGLACVPVLLVTGGMSPQAGLAIALLSGQALIALAVPRAARLDPLHALSVGGFCAFIGLLAWKNGGLEAPVLSALGFLVVEASVLGGRSMVGTAAGLAAATLVALAAVAGLAGPPPGRELAGQAMGLLQNGALLAACLGLGLFALREIGIRFVRERQIAGQNRLIADGFGDLVTRHDAQGSVTFAAESTLAMLSAPPSDLMGRGLFERVHVADRPAFLGAISEAVRERSLTNCRVRVRCGTILEDGRSSQPPHFKWFEMRAQGVGGDEAQPEIEAICVFRDVSAQRLHESALDEARKQAESANEMKSRFLATVSHELRTPLNAIIGFSEMLANDKLVPADDARRRDYARMINISGQHLLEVVNTLLDISKIDSGTFQLDPEPVCVEEWVTDTVGMMRLKAEEAGVAVHANIEPGLPEIVADRRACKQILINLLSNAVKFTPRGGRVSIGVIREGGTLVLAIEDTGVGIPADDLPRIGEPFFQARGSYDRPFEGTGLGFSVVRGLVALHGGTVGIDSTVGEGTRVTVRLSIDAKGPVQQAPVTPIPLRQAAPASVASLEALDRTTVKKRA